MHVCTHTYAYTYKCYSYVVIPWTLTSGLPEMYEGRRPEGVHIRQTKSGRGITVMCHSHSQKAAILVLQVHNLTQQSNLTLGTRRFCQQNYWNNRNTKATSKMLA